MSVSERESERECGGVPGSNNNYKTVGKGLMAQQMEIEPIGRHAITVISIQGGGGSIKQRPLCMVYPQQTVTLGYVDVSLPPFPAVGT